MIERLGHLCLAGMIVYLLVRGCALIIERLGQ